MQRSFTKKGIFDYSQIDEVELYEDVYALFLNSSSLIIRTKKKNAGLHGGVYYKTHSSTIFKVYENKYGEKYLKSFRETGTGLFFTDDLYQMRESSFLYQNPRATTTRLFEGAKDNTYCEEMVSLIESHLSSLLGFPFQRKSCPPLSMNNWYKGAMDDGTLWRNTPEYLSYPFLRNEENRKFAMKILEANHQRTTSDFTALVTSLDWKGTRGLTYALRNSKTKEEFVRNLVYKSAVKTEEDVVALLLSPSFLGVFSKFNFKMGAREAIDRGYATVIRDATQYMDVREIIAFQFLLQALPKKDAVKVLDLAVKLAAFRTEQVELGRVNDLSQLTRNIAGKFFQGSYQFQWLNKLPVYLQSIASADRTEFALLFWKEFQVEYLKTEPEYEQLSILTETLRNITETIDNRMSCFTNVEDAFMRAYSKMYYEALPDDAVTQCEVTAMELFNLKLSDDKTLSSKTVTVEKLGVTVDYFDFREHVSRRMHHSYSKNFFYMLKMEENLRPMWQKAFSNPSNILLGDYGRLQGVQDVILPTDLEKTLRKIAAVIDRELAKLGREATPANRIIYLQADSRSRKYKANWRYYELGVPVDEVSLYKRAGFNSKRDILFWLETKQSVSDEIYKELLHDAALGPSSSAPMSFAAF